MRNYNKNRIKSAMLTATIIGAGTAVTSASTLAINFMGGRYGQAKLDAVSATAFGVAPGDWTNIAVDDSGDGTTTLSGVTFDWVSSNEWSKANTFGGTAGDDQVYHGYMDDGGTVGPGAAIDISGLTTWLGSDTSYTITLLISGDTAAAVEAPELFVSNGGASLGTITLTGTTSQGSESGEGSIAGLSSDTLFVQGSNRVTGRGGIAGIVITTVPEPSTTALLGLGGLALILHRRK